jgi:hypothetical protein
MGHVKCIRAKCGLRFYLPGQHGYILGIPDSGERDMGMERLGFRR